jgi:hypothetical protein
VKRTRARKSPVDPWWKLASDVLYSTQAKRLLRDANISESVDLVGVIGRYIEEEARKILGVPK